MRSVVALVIAALAAAPVPKELRKADIAGTWEITTSNVWAGSPSDQYNGQRWRFAESGAFTITERGQPKPRLTGSYELTPAGLDIRFGAGAAPAKSLHECEGETMRLVNTKKNEERPPDLRPSADVVIYTFRRVKE